MALEKLRIAAVIVAGAVLISGGVLVMALNPGMADSLSWGGVTKTYPGGVSFSSPGERLFGAMHWQAGEGACPLTLHLPDGDVGLAEMATPLVLRAKGWTQTGVSAGGASYRRALRDGDKDAYAAAFRVEYGQVRTVAFRSDGGGAVTVCGKRVALPVAARALDAAFGKPLSVEQNDGGGAKRAG